MEEQKKEFTGVWIPKHIIEDEDLSWTEIILYSEIASFKICFKNNESLAKRLRLKNKESVSPLLTNLKNKGYIKEINNDGRRKYWKAILEQTNEKNKTRDKKNLIPLITNSLDIDNNIENNKNNSPQSEIAMETSDILNTTHPIKEKEINKHNNAIPQARVLLEEGEFNYLKTRDIWINGRDRAFSLIGKYWRMQEVIFLTKAQMQIGAKRHLKIANDLAMFSDEQINEAINKIQENEELSKKFTLETIIKYLIK